MFPKTFLISISLMLVSLSASENTAEKNQQALEKVHNQKVNATVDFSKANPGRREDVKYQLHTMENPNQPTNVSYDDIEATLKDKNIPLVVFVHGWRQSSENKWYGPLTKAFFSRENVNIIWVDWVYAGNMSYDVSAANVLTVGGYIAEFLVNSKVEASKILIVGFSLGSQLSHFVSKSFEKSTNQKFARITALDPTGVLFQSLSLDKKLNKADAEFVDALHTNADYFGYTSPIGHVDYFANGGNQQPGCPPDPSTGENRNCNHNRAPQYFIASFYKNASAIEADYQLVTPFRPMVTPKDHGKAIVFGQFVSQTARGVYYVKTLGSKPYLLNTYNLVKSQ